MKNHDSMGMYIHIPFCVKKCNYCDFLSFSSDETTKSAYVDSLIEELVALKSINKSIYTIFFGGGTPSILDSKHIYNILDYIYKNYSTMDNMEISLECNPGTSTLIKLSDYLYSGINRLSIGLQSANDLELKELGRIHSYTQFLETYNDARAAGFKNINIDLMSALPNQSLKSYEQTLTKVVSLKPEHVSAYSLILEEGTPLFKYINEGHANILPSEDDEREMYYMTDDILKANGYHRYEISNYSLPGYECKHNLSYWEQKEYIGVGLGASSFIDQVRYKNTSDMEKYLSISNTPSLLKEEVTPLSKLDAMEEFMFLGLRKTAGISPSDFLDTFNLSIYGIYGDILKRFEKEGLLKLSENNISLTSKGLDLSNYLFSEFILDEEDLCNRQI